MSKNPSTVKTNSLAGRTILQIVPRLEAGGAERTTVDIAEAIVKAGGTALVVAEPGRLVKDVERVGGEFINMDAASKNPIQMIKTAYALSKVIKARDVDIVHARSRAPAWPALWAARLSGCAFMTTYHGIYSQRNAFKEFYNSVMTRGDVVIANSGMTAALIEQRNPAAKARTKTIYRGTDLGAFAESAVTQKRRDALIKQWGLEAKDIERPLILNIARISSWKGQDVLTKAMHQLLKAQIPDNPLLILAGGVQGDDGFLVAVQNLIEELGLSNHVRLVGHCDDVPAAMSLATCAVVASTREEAFGRAAVEAGAAKIPAIVTDHGGARETVLVPPGVLEQERTGWRVPPGDINALTDALKIVLNLSAQERYKIGERAREHATANFSLDSMCDQTLAVYGSLLRPK
ncbi:MAG: glycosyltransferase family 4 protein [Hyphomicrobiales bacterium]